VKKDWLTISQFVINLTQFQTPTIRRDPDGIREEEE